MKDEAALNRIVDTVLAYRPASKGKPPRKPKARKKAPKKKAKKNGQEQSSI
jgi:hypothetical protein